LGAAPFAASLAAGALLALHAGRGLAAEPRALENGPEEPGMAAIAGRTWELARIQMMDGTVLVPGDPSRYTLRLGADGRAAMRADCNRASASYEVAGKTLTFGPIASTRAFCPPPSISDRYLQQLGFAASFVVRDGRLHVATRADGAILEFR
jgi:para-nitrobenzyl esterase